MPKGGNLTERLNKSLKRLQTDHVDLFFIHAITGIDEMTPAIKTWAAEMKQAGKFKFFGFSTHTNMADCLAGAAKLDWIDAVMFTYNFRVMARPQVESRRERLREGRDRVGGHEEHGRRAGGQEDRQRGQAGNGRPLPETGFHGQAGQAQGRLGEPPNRQPLLPDAQPDHPLANVAAARDQVKLAREEFESLRQYALETQADYCAGCGSICQAAVGGAVPVNEVMRCLMYHRYYGEPELARETFAGLPEAVRQRLTAVDYSRAEQACPQRLAIAQLMRQAAEMLA